MDQRYRLSEYDRRRQEELRRANLPAFWVIFFLVVFTVTAVLMMM
jgi:hypothetical protein